MPATLPGVPAVTAWAIQHSDFTEALAANYLLPRPTARAGISVLRYTYGKHRPLTTGPSGALHKALLKWIVYRALGAYSEHVRVVRIHPRYRGTPPKRTTLLPPQRGTILNSQVALPNSWS